MFNKAVVIIIYNRPNHTRTLFETLRKIKPRTLFIISDGPKINDADDRSKCTETRKVFDQVDWHADVYRNYAQNNMGLKKRVSSGLDWVFENVEEAIILEDDCIPSLEFFEFCSANLDTYRNNKRIMAITGDNFQSGKWRGDGSYYYSKYNHCWGWATWRNCWAKYDGEIEFWQNWRESVTWQHFFKRTEERLYWTEIFDKVSLGQSNSWAYPWTASVWFHGGITVTPNTNLVENIGFGPEATHTKKATNIKHNSVRSLGSISSPSKIEIDETADDYVFMNHFGGKIKTFPLSMLFLMLKSVKRIFKNV